MVYIDGGLKWELKDAKTLFELGSEWRMKMFEVIGDRLIVFGENNSTFVVQIHAFRLDPLGKIVDERSQFLPSAFKLTKFSRGQIKIKDYPKNMENLRNPDSEDSLGIWVKKEMQRFLLLIKPEKPFMEMFPYLLGPTNNQETYWFGRHILFSPGIVRESVGFLVTDPTVPPQEEPVKHFMTLLTTTKLGIYIPPRLHVDSIFQPKPHYESKFKTKAFSHTDKYWSRQTDTRTPDYKTKDEEDRIYEQYKDWLSKGPHRPRNGNHRPRNLQNPDTSGAQNSENSDDSGAKNSGDSGAQNSENSENSDDSGSQNSGNSDKRAQDISLNLDFRSTTQVSPLTFQKSLIGTPSKYKIDLSNFFVPDPKTGTELQLRKLRKRVKLLDIWSGHIFNVTITPEFFDRSVHPIRNDRCVFESGFQAEERVPNLDNVELVDIDFSRVAWRGWDFFDVVNVQQIIMRAWKMQNQTQIFGFVRSELDQFRVFENIFERVPNLRGVEFHCHRNRFFHCLKFF